MGWLDFVKGVGQKVFTPKDDAAEKIKSVIEAANLGITGLAVKYDNGTVFLSGQAPNAAAQQKAVLLAGNIKGVTSVNIDGLKSPADAGQVEFYVIKRGDTLSAIAKKYYGKASAYPRIFEANKEVIKNADLIFPGQKIRIPLD